MKALLIFLVTWFSFTTCAQEGSSLHITHFDLGGRLEFTNSLLNSNKSYRIEYAHSLSGPWESESNVILFATNTLLGVQLILPTDPTQLFVRVARNLFISAAINQSNTLGMIAFEDGQKVTIFTNLTLAYTATNGRTAILTVSSNGLPDTLVDGEYIFLFRNFTSNSVDVGIVLPGGSNEVKRSVPLDPSSFSRLRELGAALSVRQEKGAPGKSLDPQTGHDLIAFGLLALSTAGCVSAVAVGTTTGPGVLIIAGACLPVFLKAWALVSGNKFAAMSSKALGVLVAKRITLLSDSHGPDNECAYSIR